MRKKAEFRNESRRERLDSLFRRADQEMDRGNSRLAFKLFLAAARAGDRSSQLNVGYCYDRGIGVRANRSSALQWYQRAYRRGDSCAAANIGTIWRDEENFKRALYWFKRAVQMGDDDSNLKIAKLYLRNDRDRSKAIPYLQRASRSLQVTEMTATEAARLLKQMTHGA